MANIDLAFDELNTYSYSSYYSAPDLYGSYFDSPDYLSAGETITIEYLVSNSSDVDSDYFYNTFYLSTDSYIDSSDYYLDYSYISGISGYGNSGYVTVDLTLPDESSYIWNGDGTYYLGMLVDGWDYVSETNESNNSNYYGLSYDYDDVYVDTTSTYYSAPDLYGSYFDSPEYLSAGETISIEYLVSNSSDVDSGSFYNTFYLSTDSYIDSSDYYLDYSYISGISGYGNSGYVTVDLTLPDESSYIWNGDGTYYLGMLVDGWDYVSETDESNNSNYYGLSYDYDDVYVDISSTYYSAPDLYGSYFDSPEYSTAGETITVEYLVSNGSDVDSDSFLSYFHNNFYLSTDSYIDSSDYFLNYSYVDNISGYGDSGYLTFDLTLPDENSHIWNGNGTYYLGMSVDSWNHVSEIDESNNSNNGLLLDYDNIYVDTTTTYYPKPDLIGSYFDVVEESIVAGDSFSVTFSVSNLGDADYFGTFYNSFYLSTDSYIDHNDYYLDYSFVEGISSGEDSGYLTVNFTPPDEYYSFLNGDGTYYLGMLVDDFDYVSESDEYNNSNTGLFYDYDDVYIETSAKEDSNLLDLNQDGNHDLLWRNSATGKNSVWYMDGGERIGRASLPDVTDASWSMEGVGDFDDDGNVDLVWRNSATGKNAVWLMDGEERIGRASLPAVTDDSWDIKDVGDFDNDGNADIVWRNESTGKNAVWLMDGGERIGRLSLPDVTDSSWDIKGVGDFDNDGNVDLLWRNESTGKNSVWFMDGGERIGRASLPDVAGKSWDIRGVGDFDSDGNVDVLWRNETTGQNSFWLMDGSDRIGRASLPTVASSNWQLII